MTTNTPTTPEPDDAAASTEVAATRTADTEVLAAETPDTVYAAPAAQAAPEHVAPAPAPRRKLGGGAIAGIAVGGVVALALIFGGGVAVGTILPVGNDSTSVQGGYPGGGPGVGEDGTRPTPPQGGPRGGDATDRSESGTDTNTQDDSD
jgi:hypothetical protein